MVVIQIDPISIRSAGGHAVTISGLRPTDHDCIIGSIVTPGTSLTKASWNLSGIMRGGTDSCNLDMRAPTLTELSDLARRLGAV